MIRRYGLSLMLLAASCGDTTHPPENVQAPKKALLPEASAPPRPTSPPELFKGPVRSHVSPAQIQLMQSYGIGEADAATRIANESHVGELSRSLRTNPPPGFSSIWIEHAPRYAVMVSWKGAVNEAAVRKRADPSLHRYILFVKAARDASEIERYGDRIIEVFRKAPGQWAGGYDVKTGKFVFDFTGPAGVAYAKKRLPRGLQGDVIVRVGSVPVPL